MKGTLLQETNSFPKEILDARARDLKSILGGPTLIHLKGKKSPALFISVLLHGNETSGFLAIQKVLKKYANKQLPRDLSIFIGNVKAAEKGLRFLPGQPDFNRIWPGGISINQPEQRMAAEVLETMKNRGVFASIDIHNNTGKNPHYACINVVSPPFLQLATLFNSLVVYYLYPKGVQSFAFSSLAPAVTLECGLDANEQGVDHASNYIEECLKLVEFEKNTITRPFELFHTIGTVTIATDTKIGFESGYPLQLCDEIEGYNFKELGEGTVFAHTSSYSQDLIIVKDEQGNKVTSNFFKLEDGSIKLTKKVMPAMLTKDLRVIKQDCLCYLMERYPYQQSNPTT
ncbi:MAG: M14 family metallopeptidase [Oligoflexales bacterium]